MGAHKQKMCFFYYQSFSEPIINTLKFKAISVLTCYNAGSCLSYCKLFSCRLLILQVFRLHNSYRLLLIKFCEIRTVPTGTLLNTEELSDFILYRITVRFYLNSYFQRQRFKLYKSKVGKV